LAWGTARLIIESETIYPGYFSNVLMGVSKMAIIDLESPGKKALLSSGTYVTE
jgi:hypothetical protein